MARPENPINSTGPTADFAQQLRLLRQHAALTLRQLADLTGLSTATLSVAASGRELPTWEVSRVFVRACGGDADEWRERWEHAARFSRLPPAMRLPGGTSRTSGRRAWKDNLGALGGPAPLPVTAETTSEFMDCLRRVKIWAGDPPVRTLARQAGLPASTMQDFLHRRRGMLPAVEMVCAFLEACGIDDPNVLGEWVYAWRRLKFAETEKRRKRARRTLLSALQTVTVARALSRPSPPYRRRAGSRSAWWRWSASALTFAYVGQRGRPAAVPAVARWAQAER
jgi:DNA-binding XRE family transcriptional regulator